jgi:hypothetical protein
MIVREKWLGPERFVRVSYNPGEKGISIAVEIFTPDPRKKQYHKPKYWCRSASYGGSIESMRDRWLWRKDAEAISAILDEIESLNGISSDRRAAAS